MVNVTKRDGTTEPFKSEKIERSIIKAGGKASTAKKIAQLVRNATYEGITTDEIRVMVIDHLNNIDRKTRDSYSEYQKTENLEDSRHAKSVKRK